MIDEILDWLAGMHSTKPKGWNDEMVTSTAKAQLLAEILKVIGEDEPFSLDNEKKYSEFDLEARSIEAQNKLRQLQRTKLEQLFKEK